MALYKSHGAESPDIRIPVSRQSWIELARNTAVDFPRISTPVSAPRISVGPLGQAADSGSRAGRGGHSCGVYIVARGLLDVALARIYLLTRTGGVHRARGPGRAR